MKKILILFLAGLLVWSCRTPFEPEIPPGLSSVLVVEGYLDSEGLESILKLSRTVPIKGDTTFSPEVGAQISLVSNSGQTYFLKETEEQGSYLFSQNIAESGVYRLEIILRNGEVFRSDPMRPIVSPDILDAGFVRDEEGVEVFVTTQGDANADDFLWTYEETWIYRPRIRTPYIYDKSISNVRTRKDNENISRCFKSDSNPDILLETSSRFQEQVVFRQTIKEIPVGDERIQERYSILISQKALEPDAVKFWETLKRNTEDIGSIFSPLPSQITGNIRSVSNESIPVVGQVSLGVVKQRRIYIDLEQVDPWNYQDPEFDDCTIRQDTIFVSAYNSIFGNGFVLPATAVVELTTTIGYLPVDRRCADCTLYASPVEPDFWKD